MDSNQREYYLREQMKAIQKELGGEEGVAETEELRNKVDEKNMPEEAKKRALKEIDRLEKMPGGSPEATVVRTYLDVMLELPGPRWTRSIWTLRTPRRFSMRTTTR